MKKTILAAIFLLVIPSMLLAADIQLPENLQAKAYVIKGERDGLWEKSLIVQFPERRRTLGTLDGFVEAFAALNHSAHPLLWQKVSETFMSQNGRGGKVYTDFMQDKVAGYLKIGKNEINKMATAADMDNLAVVTREFKPLTVTVLATAGAKTNAIRTGVDVSSHIEGEEPHGTINIVLLTNVRLTDGAMARAIITVTEAKTAALEDLKVPSSYTKNVQATGTGTDSVIVVSGTTGPRATYTGGHSKLGELIGKATYQAVVEALGKQNGFKLPVKIDESITLETTTGVISGILEIPKTSKPVPVALIISGSGPTDRDGNSALAGGKNDSLKMLAAGLVGKGIASLRYDKRGVAASIAAVKREDDLRFETYIDDAELWGKRLRQDNRFSKLIVIGHSEGALVGTVAAGKIPADSFVSIAGQGSPACDLMESQLKRNLPPAVLSESKNILYKLRQGQIAKTVPASLMSLFRPTVQPYLISWCRYNPADEISKLNIPVLIMQGTTDLQVGTIDAQKLANANSKSELYLIEGVNHVLKKVTDNLDLQIKSYSDPSLPVPNDIIDTIASFASK